MGNKEGSFLLCEQFEDPPVTKKFKKEGERGQGRLLFLQSGA